MKIVLQNVTKKYADRKDKKKTVIAVRNFNLEIPDGKLVGLLGPSGCGKSTILNLISGLEPPTEGRIIFDEDDITDLQPEHRGIGLVFQNYALYPHLTVLQNILFPLQNLKGKDKLTKENMNERALKAARLVQIDGLMDRKPGQLSGGQQQRVAIARALVKTPNVLLLDEPLSNLDARLRLQTREEIKHIQQETGVTTIFVTHDQEEAMSICDIIVVMKDGVVMQTGKPQNVYDDPKCLFVAEFLGTPPINKFNGRIKDGQLFIGDEAVLPATGIENQEVYVGIRPEGFIINDEGPFTCSLGRVEVMGRDMSIIAHHKEMMVESIRAIISSENADEVTGKNVRFSLKPYKTVVFSKKTEDRIYIEGNKKTASKSGEDYQKNIIDDSESGTEPASKGGQA